MDVQLIRRLRLQFPPATEAEFRADFFRKSLRPVRVLYVIAILLFLLFIPIDSQILPSGTFVAITAIRLTATSILIGQFAFTFSPQFERWWQGAVSATCILFGLSVALMTAGGARDVRRVYESRPFFWKKRSRPRRLRRPARHQAGAAGYASAPAAAARRPARWKARIGAQGRTDSSCGRQPNRYEERRMTRRWFEPSAETFGSTSTGRLPICHSLDCCFLVGIRDKPDDSSSSAN